MTLRQDVTPRERWAPTPHMVALEYPIRDFARDLIAVLDRFGGNMVAAYEEAAPIIDKLLSNVDLWDAGQPRQANHADGAQWLYFDYELEVQLSSWRGGVPIPVHDHGTWEFVAPLHGAFDYTSYRRLDDGSETGLAELEVVDQRTLVRGDSAVTGLPPNDIHSFVPMTDDSIILGMNHGPLAKTRHYYDPAQRTVVVRDAKAWRLGDVQP